jgi:surface antigen
MMFIDFRRSIMRAGLQRLIPIFCSALMFGCSAPPTQEQSGMVIGGVLGGALGSQIGSGEGSTVAAVVGTLIGAAIGGNIGRSMDDLDRVKFASTLEHNKTGAPSRWVNPDSGSQYTVTPTLTHETKGSPCREFTVDGVVGGRKEKVYGTACRQQDGSWRVIK